MHKLDSATAAWTQEGALSAALAEVALLNAAPRARVVVTVQPNGLLQVCQYHGLRRTAVWMHCDLGDALKQVVPQALNECLAEFTPRRDRA